MATYLSRTPSGAGNRKTFTFSMWVKKSDPTTQQALLGSYTDSSNRSVVRFSNSRFEYQETVSGTDVVSYITTAKYRDPSAWYHFVLRVDTTQASSSDRIRIYVNGTQETQFDTSTTPSQNTDLNFNNNIIHYVGARSSSGSPELFFTGYLAQTIFIDGTSYAPTSLGSTNSDGVWIQNAGPSVTYGTNGFRIDFKGTGANADTSGFGADTSGNNNHFATTSIGTNPSTKDSPTNNFAVINAAANYYAGATLAEGATKITTDGANYTYNVSSIGVSAGKWYVEAKIGAGINNWFGAGIAEGESSNASGVLGRDTYYPAGNEFGQIGWYGNGTDFVYQNDGYYSGSTSDYDTDGYTTGDIISIALDADNNNVKFYKNGTVQNSGNAFTLGASSTGFWHFAFGDYDGQNAGSHTFQVNFGNPAFTIASSNADANGYGSFEYAVPSGYYALCTKNLATYG
jgi:hypothetical protein